MVYVIKHVHTKIAKQEDQPVQTEEQTDLLRPGVDPGFLHVRCYIHSRILVALVRSMRPFWHITDNIIRIIPKLEMESS